ncbi:MAG: zinc-binding dehydrogenase, partial [Alphaproteobacteria bacterium]|nr:zinc-binding dehydrogenase [Alphaproteobacteria bacterium]
LFFTAPFQTELRSAPIPDPNPDELLVETHCSAISPGTELLIYRGQAPTELPADETIAALGGELTFPLQYGYAAVGQVIAIGSAVSPDWLHKTVFSFQPHQTHFTATSNQVIELPPDIPPEAGVFLPNMETAVNLVMDGAPLIGERVAVFGQGVIGLLTTALLAQFPLADLIVLDRFENRRTAAAAIGATLSLDPVGVAAVKTARGNSGCDLVYEISGTPAALDQAIAVTGFDGRIVIGSWYGTKRAPLDLGGAFHRSRIRLISSQVSTLAPSLTGRWDKARRFNLAWDQIQQIQPQRWITHTIPFEDAAAAYRLSDQRPEETIQVLFTYK